MTKKHLAIHITCACGCGGYIRITITTRRKKYIDDSHRKAHERQKARLLALESGWRSESRPCKCGCGKFFYPTIWNQRYINGHNTFWIPRDIKYQIKHCGGRQYNPKDTQYGVCLGIDPDSGEHCTNGKPKGKHFCPECSSRNETMDELTDYEFGFGIID